MDERKNENKKLLILIAVLTLILVLSVGGVYAYFAASATNTGAEITGRTLDINGTTLTIAAQRVNLNPTPAPVSDNLVPAKFGVLPYEITTTEVNRALDKKCSNGGYTGCHVWKITASTTQNIPSANIRLNLSLTNVQNTTEWSYVVYTGEDTESSNIINKGLFIENFRNNKGTIDIHKGASLTAGTPAIYYVMVYLNNTNSVQNDGVTVSTTNATGTYNGTVTLEAMGGEVYVNFYEPEPTNVEYFAYTVNNNEVTITDYLEQSSKPTVAYTVTDQSACESYFENDDLSPEEATTFCTGGSIGDIGSWTLADSIAEGEIPSSDYAAAGLSNVAITYETAPTDVVIPSEIRGYPVTTIASNAFWKKGLTSVVIPNSVTEIERIAFRDNQLTSITIENQNVTIRNCAFGENPPLREPFLSNYVCEKEYA